MKVLLISDASMNVNRGGFQQTLYNIFLFAEPKDFLLVTSLQAYKASPPSAPFDKQVLTYNTEVIPVQHNRFGKFVNSFINWFNYSFNDKLKHFKNIKSIIKKFDADVVVIAPNGAEGVLMYHLLNDALKQKKVFPYFMDDWLYQSKLKWFGGNIHSLAKKLLAKNISWMMISESLGNILAERYNFKPAKILAIHNPVNMHDVVLPKPVAQKNEYTIAYAGALWQMHFDALLVIAKAIQILKKQIKIKLVIYTEQNNWDWRKDELTALQVEYGGHIPYTQIHATLTKADCLLVTSSFTKEWQTHSQGSVQTKITDYLKAGRLIISCGPSYSANHQFLKQHECGVCIETNDEKEAAINLKNILILIELNQVYVKHGYEVLQNEFSFEVVHERLRQFLAA